jgi:hypothetical protein
MSELVAKAKSDEMIPLPLSGTYYQRNLVTNVSSLFKEGI